MKVVVTGGAGFIGANLCRLLGSTFGIDEVLAFDDLSTGSASNLLDEDFTKLVEGDILDLSALKQACEGADSIVHLAARPSVPRSLRNPLSTHCVNTTGTANVLEAARAAGNVHTIVASSSSIYGTNPELPTHEGLKPCPVSPYAATKLAAETYALAWQYSFGLPVLAFRFFNVFGPLQTAGHAYAAVVPAFVSAALAGEPLPVHGDGMQTRDFTYVGSVAAVITEAVTGRVTSPGPVNLAFGSRVTLNTVICEIENLLGHSVNQHRQPNRAGDVPHSQADNRLLRSLFPSIQPVALTVGLAETLRWFRAPK